MENVGENVFNIGFKMSDLRRAEDFPLKSARICQNRMEMPVRSAFSMYKFEKYAHIKNVKKHEKENFRMKKFRQIAFILMLALSLTTFAACGKDNKADNNGNAGTTNEATDNTGGNDTNNAGDNAKDDMDDAVDNAGDAIKDTGDAIEDGLTDNNADNNNDVVNDNGAVNGVNDNANTANDNANTTDNNNR